MDFNFFRHIAPTHPLDVSRCAALRPASGDLRQAIQPGHTPYRRTSCPAIPRGSLSSHGNQVAVTRCP